MGRGRPSKLTDELQEKLCDRLRQGNYYEAACGAVGIEYQTFRNWMQRGEQAKSGKYFEFFEAVTRAEYEAEARMVEMWQAQMPEDWRAARDFLARRYPERWLNRERLEHSGPDGGAIEISAARQELDARLDSLAERRREKAIHGESE